MSNEKNRVMWIENASGVSSGHRNEPDLTFEASLIGHIHSNKEWDSWSVLLKDGTNITPAEGCASLYRARAVLEAHYFKSLTSQRYNGRKGSASDKMFEVGEIKGASGVAPKIKTGK